MSRDSGQALPLVSVVVPCRNRAHFLQQTLDSILNQDYPHVECIVRDGASTDGTVALLREYGERVRWHSEPDRGPFDAINAGWAEARGQILAWLNADDTWEPGAARHVAEYFLRNPDVDVVSGTCGLMDDAGKLQMTVPARQYHFESALLHCDHVLMQAATFLRRRAVDAAGPLYPSWTHDQELWLRAAQAGARFATTDAHVANVRVGPGHTHDDPGIMIPARLALTERMFADPRLPHRLRPLRAEAVSNAYVRGFDILRPRERGHWRWGWYCLRGAVAASPAHTPHVLKEIGGRALRRFETVDGAVRLGWQSLRAATGLAARAALPGVIAFAILKLQRERVDP
ncbi:MAG: glycosyltransferase [Dehalococcoidia bacterium]|nr:glycosyltransferase [Dehalococcoidia bacterium]